MNKTTTLGLSVVLIIWLIGGAIWFAKNYTRPSGEMTRPSTKLVIEDEDFKLVFPSTFAFEYSSSEVILSESQEGNLAQLALYLMEHPKRQLALSGMYHAEESNFSDFDNLGKARAETIKEILRRNGALDNQLITKGIVVNQLPLTENELINGGILFNFNTIESLPLLDKFEENYLLTTKDNQLVFPENFDSYLVNLRQYLVDHPKAQMQWKVKAMNSTLLMNWTNQIKAAMKKHNIDIREPQVQLIPIEEVEKDQSSFQILVQQN